MTTIVERRYLLDSTNADWRNDRQSAMRIQQGYLLIRKNYSLYVSLENSNKASLCFRKENLGVLDTRYKVPLPRQLGNILFWCCGKRVVKRTRHQAVHARRTFRINEFRDVLQGLLLVEIELTHTDEVVVLPPWVSTDVTMDPRYTFAQLARNGVPSKRSQRRAV